MNFYFKEKNESYQENISLKLLDADRVTNSEVKYENDDLIEVKINFKNESSSSSIFSNKPITPTKG